MTYSFISNRTTGAAGAALEREPALPPVAAAPHRVEPLSLVIPAYRNEENVPDLIKAVEELDALLGRRLEVIFVIDGSPDRSGEVLLAACSQTALNFKVIFHSRNFGSFTAIRTGLEFASGRHFAVMAADLQEPIELIVRFFEILESGEADVVFGQRVGRHDSLLTNALSD